MGCAVTRSCAVCDICEEEKHVRQHIALNMLVDISYHDDSPCGILYHIISHMGVT